MGFALIISMIIAISGVITSFSAEIFGITEKAGDSPSLYIQTTSSYDDIPAEVLDLLNHTNIVNILPIAERKTSFISDVGLFNAYLIGVNTSELFTYFPGSYIYAGRLPRVNTSSFECVVGKNINQLIGSSGLDISDNSLDVQYHLDVVGLIQDVREFQNAIIVELPTYNRFFNQSTDKTLYKRIIVRLKSGYFVDETISDLQVLLKEYNQNLTINAEQQADVFTESLFYDIITKLNLLFGVLFIIALIRIFHAISWFVKKYERDLLIMRAMGLSPSQVIIIVVIISVIIGNLGVFMGIILGVTIPPILFVIINLSLKSNYMVPHFTISSFLVLLILSNLIATIAAIYPAVIIGKKAPSKLTLSTHDIDR